MPSQLLVFVFLLLIVAPSIPAQSVRRTPPSRWPNKEYFLNWLLAGCETSADERARPCQANDFLPSEYEGYDGWYNNMAKPDQGAVDTPLLRLLPPAYSDGVYHPAVRPANPLAVSNATMRGANGQLSRGGKTAFLVFFGQQVVEELLDAQRPGCPPEYFNIPVPDDHEYRVMPPHLKEMPLLRSRYDASTGYAPNNPRQQLNEITPYLDGGLVYGVAKGWADVLRTFSNGSLAPRGLLAWHDELGEGFPAANTQRLPMANPPAPTNHSQYLHRQRTAPVNRFFKLGNPRGNENPFLLTFGIFFFRWHNAVAKHLNILHSNWSDERLFNEARKWVIATHQSLVLYDWLPKWLRKELPEYQGYQPTVDPQISHVFQSAAMRFGHTLVTSGVYLRRTARERCETVPLNLALGEDGGDTSRPHSAGVRTCNSFWRSPELFKKEPQNFERFLMGLSSQSTEREDNIIVDDLRGRVFGPLEFSRRDLMAVNIQRGRDHGLPDYNTARKHFGLKKLLSIDPNVFQLETETDVDREVLKRLQEVYRDINQVDIWAGGLMETKLGPGQLFSKIITDQFERIRNGDRFWFENENNGQFKKHEIERIKQIRIIDLVLLVTNLTLKDIQEDPFTAVHSQNDLPDCRHLLMSSTNCTLPLTNETTMCYYLPPLGDSNLEACTPPKTFDYFTGSAAAYILTFFAVAVTAVGLLVTMLLLTRLKQNRKAYSVTTTIRVDENGIVAKERVSRVESRYVVVEFQDRDRRIDVRAISGSLLRTVDLQKLNSITVRHLHTYQQVVISAEHHYDLFLKFTDDAQGHKLVAVLKKFCKATKVTAKFVPESIVSILRGIATYKKRAAELEEFSRLVLSKAFDDATSTSTVSSILELSSSSHLFSMQITRAELAAELGTAPDTLFMQQLFRLMDKDGNGFILLKEFWDVMVCFAKGSPEQKARLIFDIYDVSQRGEIHENDLKAVIESMLGGEAKDGDIDNIVASVLESVHLSRGEVITFEKFYQLFSGHESVLSNIHLQARKGSNTKNRPNRFSIYGLMREEKTKPPKPTEDKVDKLLRKQDAKEEESVSGVRSQYKGILLHIYNHQVYVWWTVVYTFVMLLIFAERAYYYSVEREHTGLRRIAGYGVTVTRGAASAMMFTYSSLLVTMCRNMLNQIRASFLHRYFPIDYMVSLHRYIGGWALLWTLIHIIGHAINFYHIATQTPPDLTCLFRDFFRSTDVLPKFQYWCWQTITGFTGVLLTLQCAAIYVFAYLARRFYFKLFWITHNSYPLFYFLIVLHGSGNLVQEPFFHYFFLGPAILFTLDKLVSASVNTLKIDVLEAQHLPSNVTLLKIRRPPNFNFHAGQWIRIASLAISEQEYHPFTLSSAPHEEHLTLHIRAVGPWTTRLRKEYPDKTTAASKQGFKYPKIYIDGPFGEGHQTWWDYEVAILVGGGIGVTPFSSILKHITHCCQQPTYNIKTKRVMFLWVTNSQKQFEWLTEILHEVEDQDVRDIVRNHIFITQFKNKFDLRTIFLYLAERHFQRVSGTSLFTGLKAITHFSRPPFLNIFRAVKEQYTFASKVGVFTCGSPALSNSVERACHAVNMDDGDMIFKHYSENF